MKDTGVPVNAEPEAAPFGKQVQGQDFSEKHFLNQLSIAFGLLAIAAAVLGIAGMVFGITLIASVYPGYKTISLSAALVWITLGSVLVINPVLSPRRGSGLVIMTILAAIAIVEAIEIPFNLLGDHFIVETLSVQAGTVLFGSFSSPNSPVAAGLITAAAAAMFFLINGSAPAPEHNRTKDAVGITGIFISLVSLTFVLSYMYGDPLLYGTQFIPIAAVSALAAFFTGAGLIAAAGPSAVPVRYVTGDSIRSRLFRTFIPLIVIIILCENLIFAAISPLFAFSDALRLSASLVLFIFITTLLVARISGGLGRLLELAEQALKLKNDDLSALNDDLMAIEEELRQNVEQVTRKERELVESNERLQLAQDASGAGIWDWNVRSGTLTWDSNMFRLFGLDKEKDTASSETWNTVLHPDDLTVAHSRIGRALQEHTNLDSVYRIIRPGGEVHWINAQGKGTYDESGQPVRLTGICIDITPRIQAEEVRKKAYDELEMRVRERTADLKNAFDALGAERHRLYDVLETLPVYVCLLDEDYRMPFANKYFRDTFGESRGRCCYEFLFDRNDPCDNCETYKVIWTRASHHWYWTGPNGRDYDIYDFPFIDSDGSFLILEMGIDITDRMIAEKGLLDAQYVLEAQVAMRTRELAESNVLLKTEIEEHKRTERALRESEQRFRLALRNAPVSVAIQDLDLVFRWAYNQCTVDQEDILGKTDSDLFMPEDAAQMIELKRRVIGTGKEVHEQIWLTVNKKRLYLDLYLEPLRDNTGQITGIGIATVDLTELKNAEQALIDNEKRLREAAHLLESVTDGAQVIIAAEDTNFRYTYFNKTYAAEIFRLTAKELAIGMNMIDLFSDLPKEQRSELNEWNRVIQGESVNKLIEFGDQTLGKKIYNVLHVPMRDEKGAITGAGEVAYDVTSQVKVEETLRETSQYLTSLIDYANAPIIVWDQKFRITRFNHAFEHLTGRSSKDVLGQPFDILLPPTYLDEAMDLIRKTSIGERWESVEIPILRKDGKVRTVLWNSASILGPDGKTIVSVIAQGQDITERKETEKKLRETLSLLNAALESMDEGVYVTDTGRKITTYNQNFVTLWDIDKAVLIREDGRAVSEYMQSRVKDPKAFFTRVNEIYKHPERESFDMIELSDGRIFERHSKPQRVRDGIIGRVWSFRDVTDRKHAEENLVASLEEKEILLREIHHRVKNNLQLISGLLDMTRMRTVDESTNSILTDMMLKIQTMAQIHTRLYESKQFGKISITGQFRDQIMALSNIYSHKGHEISCEINSQEVFLPVDQAIPCALVVNEILSNAYKHAFKGRKQGTIEISAVQEN
ncbi:MAG TPA: PAS domain S-box protein, partial [Methanoregulaceae archaeon]|nr:PAS domain S-box protein [Methanoregulaceae archaeon]